MNKFTKQCVAAFASLAMAGTLGVAGVATVSGFAASTAFAVPGSASSAEPAPWSDAGKSKTGSITITKYKDETANGQQAKETKVAGAKFKVTKVTQFDNVDLNLKKYDDWLKVAAKVPTLNATPNTTAGITLDTDNAKEVFTNDQGIAEFKNLEIGLYKVEELSTPDGYVKLANPFFMTIPEVTRDKAAKNNSYKYDVTVEPKNAYTKDAIKKTIDASKMVGARDDLPYTITTAVVTTSSTDVTKLTKDDLTDFAVWDDALKTAYDANANVVQKVKIGNTDLTKDTDYNVNTEGTPNDDTRMRIMVKFTDSGLTKIADELKKGQNSKLTVDLKFSLKDTVAAGELINKYGFQPGHKKGEDKPDPVNPPDPNPESKVTLRDFQIKKVDATDASKVLKGAKFAVFATEANAKACAADDNRADTVCKDKSAKGFDTQTETADNTGLTKAGYKAKVGSKFYVVETAAPEGYALSPAVDEVTIPNGEDTNTAYVYSFKDVPTKDNGLNWFKLPKTGAAGVIIFALAGMCLVGAGLFIFMRNRKDEEQQAA